MSLPQLFDGSALFARLHIRIVAYVFEHSDPLVTLRSDASLELHSAEGYTIRGIARFSFLHFPHYPNRYISPLIRWVLWLWMLSNSRRF